MEIIYNFGSYPICVGVSKLDGGDKALILIISGKVIK